MTSAGVPTAPWGSVPNAPFLQPPWFRAEGVKLYLGWVKEARKSATLFPYFSAALLGLAPYRDFE